MTAAHRNGLATILVVVLLVVAGCSGGVSQSTTEPEGSPTPTASETPTPTPTPSPTATPEPTLSDVSLPAGVTESSVNADLAQAHQLALSGTSLTITQSVASDFSRTTTTRVAGGAALQTRNTSGSQTTTWINQTGQFSRTEESGEVSFGKNDRRFNRESILRTFIYEAYLDAGNFRPTDVVSQDGELLIRIEADAVENPAPLQETLSIDEMKEFSATALVTQDGVIRSLEIDQSYVRDGRTTDETVALNVSAIGETAIERPSWVQKAAQQGVTVDITAGNDGQYLAVTHTGGATVESGTNVFLYLSETEEDYNGRLGSSFAEGDTIYVYVKNGGLQVTRSEPASDTSTKTLSGGVNISMFEGSSEIFSEFIRA